MKFILLFFILVILIWGLQVWLLKKPLYLRPSD
jgi:hypothetical protein